MIKYQPVRILPPTIMSSEALHLPEMSDQRPEKSKVLGFEGPDVEEESGVLPVEEETDSLPVLKALAIFISPNKGEPMQKVDSIAAFAGLGLEGDRYATRTGAFSTKPNVAPRIPDTDRQVSLISRKGISEANAVLEADGKEPYSEEQTRRNIVVNLDPDELNDLVGKQFKIGDVVLEGVELCDPCDRPKSLAGSQSDFKGAFENKGGLRARVVNNGTIATVSAA